VVFLGSGKADELERKPQTRGGSRKEDRNRHGSERKAERCVRGPGMGRVLKWNRKALSNYTLCRNRKGIIGMWRYVLDPWEGSTCTAKACDGLETGIDIPSVPPLGMDREMVEYLGASR